MDHDPANECFAHTVLLLGHLQHAADENRCRMEHATVTKTAHLLRDVVCWCMLLVFKSLPAKCIGSDTVSSTRMHSL